MDRQSGRPGKAPARRGLAFWGARTPAQRPRGRWSGLLLGQCLALLFFAGCAWWVHRKVAHILPMDRVTLSLSVQDAFGSALGRQLLAFGAATLACHALVGLAAFALARLTELAAPGRTLAHHGLLITGWYAVLVGLAMSANATWFPSSIFSGEGSWVVQDIGGWKPVTLGLAAVATLVIGLATRALWLARPLPPWHLLATGGAVLVVALTFVPLRANSVASPAARIDRPHIVIIGIDSLRDDLVEPARTESITPHIDDFLAHAHRFEDTISPLARTFGSWTTILTGRHPVTTNARVNLMPRAMVHEGETLADALRAAGYRTTYATDEVRFANIDGSYGFDQVITPPVGAADFLLGYAGDQPLVNLATRTPLGRWLFPANTANRAAYVTYDPDDFVDRLDREFAAAAPSLIAVHLTLAHWPYNWSATGTPRTPQEYRPAYRRAIERVDQQFSHVMGVLAAKRVLDNAVVVLLSDHGEALGGPTDSMLRSTGQAREIWNSLWGHGTSVMSPNQYRVLLALRPFGQADVPAGPARHGWPVSLEDVRPTLEEIAIGRAPQGVDGISLLPCLAEPARADALTARIRYTETDFNTPSTLAGRYETSGIVDEASVYYELDTASGWVQFRPDRLAELMAQKQRAAISSGRLLAALPGTPGTPARYLYADRNNPRPEVLETPPGPAAGPEAMRLWRALQDRFPGELESAAGLP
jgi:hypothetical protein